MKVTGFQGDKRPLRLPGKETGKVWDCIYEVKRELSLEDAQERNPEGIASFSPGLRGTSYPGETVGGKFNPEGVASLQEKDPQPLRGCLGLTLTTRGSSFLATPGFESESLRDSRAYWDCL